MKSLIFILTLIASSVVFGINLTGSVTSTHSNETEACSSAKQKASYQADMEVRHNTLLSTSQSEKQDRPRIEVQGCKCSPTTLRSGEIISFTCMADWSILYPR